MALYKFFYHLLIYLQLSF